MIKLVSEYAKHRYIYRLGPSVLASLACCPQVDPRSSPANCFCTDKKGFSVGGWSVSSLFAVRQPFLCSFLPMYRLHSSVYWSWWLENKAAWQAARRPFLVQIHSFSKIAVWTNDAILISFDIYNVLDQCNTVFLLYDWRHHSEPVLDIWIKCLKSLLLNACSFNW